MMKIFEASDVVPGNVDGGSDAFGPTHFRVFQAALQTRPMTSVRCSMAHSDRNTIVYKVMHILLPMPS
jgi:hypothetical protein